MVFDYIHILGEHAATLEDLYGIILCGSDEEVSDLFAEPSVQDDVCLFMQERGMDISDLDFSSKQAFLDCLGRYCPHLVTEEPINPTMDTGDMDGTPSHQEQKTIRIGGEEYFTVGELKEFLYKERDNGEMIDAIVDSLEDIINFVNEKEPDGTIAISLNKDSGLLSSEETPRERFQLLLNAFGILEANPLIDSTRYIDSVLIRVCISRSKSKGVFLDVSLEYKVKQECSTPLDVSLVLNNHTCVWSDRIKIEKHSSGIEKKEWSRIRLNQFPPFASLDDCFHLTAHIEDKQYEVRIYRRLVKELFAVMIANPKSPLGDPIPFGVCINSNWFEKKDQLVVDSVTRIGNFNIRGITWFQQSGSESLRWINQNGEVINPFLFNDISGFGKSRYGLITQGWNKYVVDAQFETIDKREESIRCFDDGYLVGKTLYNSHGRSFMTFPSWREEIIAFSDNCALVRKFGVISGNTKSYCFFNGEKYSGDFTNAKPFVHTLAVVKELRMNSNNEYASAIKTIDREFKDVEEPIFIKGRFSDVRYIGSGKYVVRFFKQSESIVVGGSFHFFKECYCICDWEGIRDFDHNKLVFYFSDVHNGLSEGFIAVKREEKWGFYNVQSGKSIDCRFDDVGDFEGGFARVELDGKWGFINRAGKIVVDCIFDKVHNICDGVFPAKKGDTWSLYMLKKHMEDSKQKKYEWYSEKIPIPFSYSYIGPFSHGFAPVHNNESGWGLITKDGYPLVVHLYDPPKKYEQSPEPSHLTPSSGSDEAVWGDPISETLGIY